MTPFFARVLRSFRGVLRSYTEPLTSQRMLGFTAAIAASMTSMAVMYFLLVGLGREELDRLENQVMVLEERLRDASNLTELQSTDFRLLAAQLSELEEGHVHPAFLATERFVLDGRPGRISRPISGSWDYCSVNSLHTEGACDVVSNAGKWDMTADAGACAATCFRVATAPNR